MTANHPSRTWKGCAMCKPHKRRGQGASRKNKASVNRQFGAIRRYSRNDTPEE